MSRDVLVVGSGIGGMRAAIDLAELGFKVHLIDSKPNAGGTLCQLDKQFPTDNCTMCQILPLHTFEGTSGFCLRMGINHKNIAFLSNTEVKGFFGEPKNFTVILRKKASYVDKEKCIGCGLCVETCKVEIPDEFQHGLTSRKAIYLHYPLINPNSYIIDIEHCTKCNECVKVCPTNAINLSDSDEEVNLSIGAVILSIGFEDFDAGELSQFGYAKFPNVITSIEFERLMSGLAPYNEGFVRPSDKVLPRRVAFLQCIGSRTLDRDYCSSACCMYALKEAISLKKLHPEIHVEIFFMDMRAFGKNYYRYYRHAKDDLNIKFSRCRVPSIDEDESRSLWLTYEREDGKVCKECFDLVVLSTGQTAPKSARELSRIFGIELNEHNFCRTDELVRIETGKEGVYVCGTFAEPKDIAHTIIEASASASKVSSLLSPSQTVSAPEKYNEKELRIGIVLCNCGRTLKDKIDFERLREFAGQLSNVVCVSEVDTLCLKDLEKIKDELKENRVSRAIFAACAPHLFEERFKEAVSNASIDPSLLETVSLREQLAWIHSECTEKALSVLSIAHQKLMMQEAMSLKTIPVTRRALIIGAGLSGMVSAISLAEQGFEVDLVEKSDRLGGRLRDIFYTIEGIDVQDLLKNITESVNKNDKISILIKTELSELDGFIGNFSARLKSASSTEERKYGAVIVASGASEYEPEGYSYKDNDKVITQRELEEIVVRMPETFHTPKRVVMIQCIGSRNDERPYCSRICCTKALKNALKLKDVNEQNEIYILYRDMMSFGFYEKYFTEARRQGVIFVRFDENEEPVLDVKDKEIEVSVKDARLQEEIKIKADYLVLSNGITANDNTALADALKVQLDDDGFFKEENPKYQPVKLSRDGVFVCGLAHSPMFINEAIAQALAVSTSVASILSKGVLEVGQGCASVNEELCDGCGVCEPVCPYDAIRIVNKDGKEKVAELNEILCRGCGVCVSACPSGAMEQKGYKDSQLIAMIDTALQEVSQ